MWTTYWAFEPWRSSKTRGIDWRHGKRIDYQNPDTIRPHIMLMTCTGAVAEANLFLHGEIGSIINAIQCRLFQKELDRLRAFRY